MNVTFIYPALRASLHCSWVCPAPTRGRAEVRIGCLRRNHFVGPRREPNRAFAGPASGPSLSAGRRDGVGTYHGVIILLHDVVPAHAAGRIRCGGIASTEVVAVPLLDDTMHGYGAAAA